MTVPDANTGRVLKRILVGVDAAIWHEEFIGMSSSVGTCSDQ